MSDRVVVLEVAASWATFSREERAAFVEELRARAAQLKLANKLARTTRRAFEMFGKVAPRAIVTPKEIADREKLAELYEAAAHELRERGK